MQQVLDRFSIEVRIKRKKLHYTQKQLAERLNLNLRTIMDVENGNTVPRFDTVIYIAQELNISLDSILFPNTPNSNISKTAYDFFAGKSEADIQKYIALCQLADTFRTEKVEATV